MSLPIIVLLFTCFLEGALFSSTDSTPCLPQTCNGLDIRTPFWIPSLQESTCGSPGFDTTCHENKPLIKINGDDFIVLDIFYKNHSFLLAKSDVFDDGIKCPMPQSNFSVVGTPFSYGPATANLFFLYNCTNPYDKETYRVDCASSANRYSFAVFHVEVLKHWNYSIESCQALVNTPVEGDRLDKLLKMNYTEILKKGFVLQWNGGECSSCPRSGSGLNVGRKVGIGVGAAAFSAFIMYIAFVAYHRRYKKRYGRSSLLSRGSSYPSLAKDLEKVGVHIFDYNKLEEATDHFNPKRELGDGGYGAVYKGKLQDGRVVARVEQFMNEVEILTRLRHQNLVSLYGCTSCNSRGLLLVYEYIPNGTLADHLHGSCAKPGSLSWITRLNIAIETATALAYLHASDVIHRDIKTTNILLDNNFMVKVADFGLCRLLPMDVTHVSTAPQGTPGYVDPEYNEFYQLTEKSDVYSFGVVLIELISSKPAVDITRHQCEINLSTMAINKIQNRALHELVDPHLGFDSDYKVRTMIILVAELAFQCLQTRRDMRPQMQDVLNVLLEIQTKDYFTDVVDFPADDILLLKGNSPSLSPNSNSN
ncbi:Serine/threonine protein kinase [Handroanthus impetiginosus]|uniref:non-specific serine/threonine protein kinase n=1 Tax=Handroanthus impetiginosus TaxID=429701 RepID=A0A2G9H8T6_9LAMI|nr:Serine/threonine protein kinase [Handroanthus impetiginosus]